MRLIDADALAENWFYTSETGTQVVELIEIEKAPTIEVEPTLRKLLNGEWVDTEEVETAFSIDFATGMSLFKLSREAEWNAAPLEGQKITTKFGLKSEPVKHGQWVNPYINFYGHPCHCCSECGFKASYQDKNYCPNCGVKMDLEE